MLCSVSHLDNHPQVPCYVPCIRMEPPIRWAVPVDNLYAAKQRLDVRRSVQWITILIEATAL